MGGRAALVTDAAIRVLAVSGSRGLTHRAVDAAAALPAGATSNLFRTRRALVAAVVDAILERDQRRLSALASDAPSSAGALAAAFVTATLEEGRDDVLARAALLLDPDGEQLRRARDRFVADGAHLPAIAAVPPRARRTVVVLVDGILLDAALFGARHDPRTIASTVDGAVAAQQASEPGAASGPRHAV